MRFVALLTMILATVPALAAVPATGPATAPARSNAAEQVPPAMIGTWKLALAESHFPEGKAPKAQIRIFDYTADGMLQVDYVTTGPDGSQNSGNWTSAFDGAYRPEYMRRSGATPFAMVRFTKKDDRTFDLQAAKHGVVFESGQITLSPDEKTMTFAYQAGGSQTVAVYHPWNLID